MWILLFCYQCTKLHPLAQDVQVTDLSLSKGGEAWTKINFLNLTQGHEASTAWVAKGIEWLIVWSSSLASHLTVCCSIVCIETLSSQIVWTWKLACGPTAWPQPSAEVWHDLLGVRVIKLLRCICYKCKKCVNWSVQLLISKERQCWTTIWERRWSSRRTAHLKLLLHIQLLLFRGSSSKRSTSLHGFEALSLATTGFWAPTLLQWVPLFGLMWVFPNPQNFCGSSCNKTHGLIIWSWLHIKVLEAYLLKKSTINKFILNSIYLSRLAF